jgi:predicted nucleotidyltransferase
MLVRVHDEPVRLPAAVAAVISAAAQLPNHVADVLAVAIVGSWARANATADSDVDIIVLCQHP